MCIIEFHKIVLKSCFLETFKSNTYCIDPKSRSTGMCRNSLCINTDLSIFLCYLIFLKLCLCKYSFQSLLQSLFGRNNYCGGIAHCVKNKTTICRNDFRVLGISHHLQKSLFAMNTRKTGIRGKAAG